MLISKILSNKKNVNVWGSGNQKRNYLHAYDCAIIFKKLFDLCYTKQPVNIAHDKTISIKELVILIRDKAKLKTTFHFDTSKPEGRFIKSSDTKLLKSLIPNHLNIISLEKGIIKMIDWYKSLSFNK